MYIADLHTHSKYSRATSKECTPEYLDLWARRKGIQMIGSGDFTHPAWRDELKEKLEPAEDGFYVLKKEYRILDGKTPDHRIPRFVITGEISSIYKKYDKVRKVHSLLILPGLEAAETLSRKLEVIGNLHADGRPILGLDCRDLLEMMLETVPGGMYVPAHIWTPHFSMFGAFSGFDTVEDCFGDLSSHIHAVETGLSSDPPMNWRVSMLDRFQLISNSDAHSPSKLGREANLLDIDLSYEGLKGAIQKGDGLSGTIEFFPEEGKYHMDGHRKCNLCLSPSETKACAGKCPVCGRKITIGVSHRIEQLADRPEGFVKDGAKGFESLVPLPEVIAASMGVSSGSKKVQKEYEKMLQRIGPEFEILRTVPLEEIRQKSGFLIAEGIERLRSGEVERIPGFDGEYGTIKLFQPYELEVVDGQMDFFASLGVDASDGETVPGVLSETMEKQKCEQEKHPTGLSEEKQEIFNIQQEQAVRTIARRTAVVAGPGTGKTKTLVSHMIYLLEQRKVKPGEITAVTFTNQAAAEMRERLERKLGKKKKLSAMQIGTFHAICMNFLKTQGVSFSLLNEREAKELAEQVTGELDLSATRFLQQVSMKKSGVVISPEESEKWQRAYAAYELLKKEQNLFDFDDLLLETMHILKSKEDTWSRFFTYLMVDEFQDINPVQYKLLQLWNQKGRELFVIGDPDQSIYGFRGSDATCFEQLKQTFPDLEQIQLIENYRSYAPVLNAAQAVIAENPGGERILHANRYPKTGTEAAPVRLLQARSEFQEAEIVAQEISRLTGGLDMLDAQRVSERWKEQKAYGFDEIAVLYRTHRQARLLERCLKKEGIPYVAAGKEDFLQNEKVQGTIQFLQYLDNQRDEHAGCQALKLLWNLEETDIAKEILRKTAERFLPVYQKKKPAQFFKQWMKEMQLEQAEEMQMFERMTTFFTTMPEFLKMMQLGVEGDLKRCGKKGCSSGAVTLMTLHGAKGLEFPVTMICGVEQGKIPLESEAYSTDLEEERRLLYVGMTRAKEELILVSANKESEFFEKVNDNLIQRESVSWENRKKQPEYTQMSLFD